MAEKISAQEFAALIGVSKEAVSKAIKKGRLNKSATQRGRFYEIDPFIGRAEWDENNGRPDLGHVDHKTESVPFAKRGKPKVEKSQPAKKTAPKKSPRKSPPETPPEQPGREWPPDLVDDDGNAIAGNVESQRRMNHYKAAKLEREHQLAEGLLVPIEVIGEMVEQEYQNVRKGFLGIGSDLAPQLALLTNEGEIKNLIDAAVAEVLTGLTADQKFDDKRRSA